MGDGGFGQPSQSSESWPWDTGGSQHGYSVSYAYTLAGDRSTSTYLTDNGSTTWQYDNYGPAGQPQKGGPPSRVPQTMRLLSSGSPTAEEFHYLYDGAGALQATSFAMTPESGFTPTGSNPWYDPADLASTRARAVYDNAASGQNQNLNYYWDTWNSEGSNYGSSGIYGYSYSYDPVSMLKTGAVLNDFNAHEEAYGYAPALDYLNSANYNSGDGGTTETWSYDAAGNRLSDSSNPGTWSYDNLNRMTASPGLTYSNDILGNRLSNSATSNGWDQLCRMTSFTSGSTTTNYTYRSDGMRALKAVASGNSTSFAYDGQMGFEDVDAGSNAAVTDYAIGARGIDRLAKTSGGTTSVGYPIYDGHGNMVSTLSESGSSYLTGNGRQYDAWGNILNADGSRDPKGRYCANLGHKQDDESGLIYMRARYCDAKVGRFASEDPKTQGRNWFTYVGDDPINQVDSTGCGSTTEDVYWWGMLAGFLGLFIALAVADLKNPQAMSYAIFWASVSVIGFAAALGQTEVGAGGAAQMAMLKSGFFALAIASTVGGLALAKVIQNTAGIALVALSAYSLMLTAALLDIACEDGEATD